MKNIGNVNPEHLQENAWYKAVLPVVTPEAYALLVEGISADGIRTPVGVEEVDGRYVIISGYSRKDAALELRHKGSALHPRRD